MSITEELRRVAAKTECANGRCGKLYRGDLDHIADRIEEELANYIELPKDADGETIHLGDVMEFTGDSVDEDEVSAFVVGGFDSEFPEGQGRLLVADDDGNNWYPDQLCHVTPDSWERIIEDAQADGVRYHNDGKPSDFEALVERCKRLAGEGA